MLGAGVFGEVKFADSKGSAFRGIRQWIEQCSGGEKRSVQGVPSGNRVEQATPPGDWQIQEVKDHIIIRC